MASSSESGAQLFSRLGARRSAAGLDPAIFPEDYPKPSDIYEVYGDDGSGKSELFLHLVVRAIVPTDWKGIKLHGLGIGVVYIDTDNKFCMLRLSTLLETFIGNTLYDDQSVKCEETELESVVKASLTNFWLIRCKTSDQLFMTVHSLDSFIGAKFDVALLIIDSISAFYWTDKHKCGDNRKMLEHAHKRLVAALEKLVNTYNLVLFVSKTALIKKRFENVETGLSPSSPSYAMVQNKSADHYELLSNCWTKFIKYRWILSKFNSDGGSASKDSTYIKLNFTDKVSSLGCKSFKVLPSGIKFAD